MQPIDIIYRNKDKNISNRMTNGPHAMFDKDRVIKIKLQWLLFSVYRSHSIEQNVNRTSTLTPKNRTT